MSLEDTIRGLTDAVNALNATLQSARVDVPAPATEAPPAPKEKAPKAVKAEAPKPLTKPEEPITTGASTATSDLSATTAGISYDTVAKAITDTFTKDRAKVFAALAKFGAAKGPQLKPADYAAFLAELA